MIITRENELQPLKNAPLFFRLPGRAQQSRNNNIFDHFFFSQIVRNSDFWSVSEAHRRSFPQKIMFWEDKTILLPSPQDGCIACSCLLGRYIITFFIVMLRRVQQNKQWFLNKGYILIPLSIKFHITGATHLPVKIFSFFCQNMTQTDFDENLIVNQFFFLPMGKAFISK